MRSKGGQKYAIVATARKLAIIYYKMVRYKMPFTPFNLDEYHQKYKQAKIAYLEKTLRRLKQAA
jgi:transposase